MLTLNGLCILFLGRKLKFSNSIILSVPSSAGPYEMPLSMRLCSFEVYVQSIIYQKQKQIAQQN